MKRLKLFWSAAGGLGAIVFAALFALFTYGSMMAVANQDWNNGLLAFLPAFLFAGLIHRALIPWIGPVMHTMRIFWGLIVANAILRPKGGWFANDDWILFPATGFYMGCYFWLLSSYDAVLAIALHAAPTQPHKR